MSSNDNFSLFIISNLCWLTVSVVAMKCKKYKLKLNDGSQWFEIVKIADNMTTTSKNKATEMKLK